MENKLEKCKHKGCKNKLDYRNKIGYCNKHKGEPKIKDLTGKQIGYLYVKLQCRRDKNGKVMYLCICKCGNIKRISSASLRKGTKSCGCLISKRAKERIHGVQAISAKKRIILPEIVQLRIDEKHGKGTILLDFLTYYSLFYIARFVHKQYGEFWAKPISVSRGSSHPRHGRHKTNEHLKKRKITEKEVISRLKDNKEGILIKPNTFKSIKEKATFIHPKHGEWEGIPTNVLSGRGNHPIISKEHQLNNIKKTNRNRYGVDFVAQVSDFSLKSAKNQGKIVEILNWKTGEKQSCQGGWEVAVVNYLNNKKIGYLWQPKVFPIPLETMVTPKGNKTTYRPDLLLIEENKYIEVKGYFRDDAMQKWYWFHKTYPNSELWNEKKLKEMGIL